jgi:peptide/nickel transport system substrate-binding protein
MGLADPQRCERTLEARPLVDGSTRAHTGGGERMSLRTRKASIWLRPAAMVIGTAFLLTGTIAAVALAQSATPAASGSKKTTFIYGVTGSNSSLNPMVGFLAIDYTLWSLEYNLPIEFTTKDFGADLDHSIVTSVDTASDNMSFTYHMRSGLKWSDGQPFTANDVAWTLNYYKKNDISNYSGDMSIVKNVEATNDTTFVVHSVTPTSVLNGKSVWMYEYILPEHIWSTKDPTKFKDVPAVGSGPWVAAEYKPGDSVTMERNPNFWGTQVGLTPHVDVIIEKMFNDENQMAAALQRGEIDFAFFDSASLLNSLKSKPNVAIHGAQIPLFDELAFNTGSAFETNPTGGFKPHGDGIHATTDPAFRRAVAEAIDKQTLVDKVYGGYAAVADSPVQPGATTGNWDPAADEALNFNLDKARADLAAAGYKDTDGNGIVNDPKTGKDVVLRYYTRTSDSNTIKTAPFVKSWLKQIGVGVKVFAVSNDKLSNIILAGTYEMFHWDWFPNPDPNYILGIFTCGQRPPNPETYDNSDSYFCDPEYDNLYKQQLTATSTDQRVAIVHHMQQILYDQEPYITLAYTNYLEAYRTDRFTGYIMQPEKVGDLLATWGPFAFINLRPIGEAGTAPKSEGIPGWVWIGIVVGIAIIAAAFVLARRRVGDEDRA